MMVQATPLRHLSTSTSSYIPFPWVALCDFLCSYSMLAYL